MGEDYGKMKLGEIRQRIKDGDEDASAYMAERYKPVQDAFSRISERFLAARIEPPIIERPTSVVAAHAELDEVSRRAAEERGAAVEREQAMTEGIARLRELAEDSAFREDVAEARERKMYWLTVASVIFTAVAAIAAVVAVLAAG